MQLEEFHRIVWRHDPATGLRMIFAIHDITLGPAAGGCRRWCYRDDRAALGDVTRLAHGMTYKNALAGIPFGGGKSVILARPGEAITDAHLEVFGQWVEELDGEYVTAEDVGMRVRDMVRVARETRYVTGIGKNGLGGDPGPKTAHGVYLGIRIVAERLGISKLCSLAVAIQGLGNVGMSLCEALHRAGVRLVVADIDPQKAAYAARRFGASVVHVDEILMAEVDVLAPCALGGVITVELATNMRAHAIGGSANNQLATAEVGHILHDRRVLYAPDYVINAGGVISVANEYLGRRGAEAQIAEIECRLQRIFEASDAQREPTNVVADTMAREVLMAVGAVGGQRTASSSASS